MRGHLSKTTSQLHANTVRCGVTYLRPPHLCPARRCSLHPAQVRREHRLAVRVLAAADVSDVPQHARVQVQARWHCRLLAAYQQMRPHTTLSAQGSHGRCVAALQTAARDLRIAHRMQEQ